MQANAKSLACLNGVRVLDLSQFEAVCVDAATPSVDWITASLAERGWTLKLVVSTHRHWDHIGDNAAVVERTGATLAAHVLDRHGLKHPSFTMAPPFPIVPSVPALDLAISVAAGTPKETIVRM